MGEPDIDQQFDEKTSQAFMKALLEDLRELEYMIATGGFETGVARIGAEQEMFLVDRNMRPAPISLEVLDHAKDSRLTTVTSSTPTLEAMEIMRRSGIGCLPVVDDNRLVGIVTSYDFLTATASLFEQHLAASAGPSDKEKVVRGASPP